MIAICDALDTLYFQPYYTDICVKSQIYGLFRNDLATPETRDPKYEAIVCSHLGIRGAWCPPDSKLALIFGNEDWAKRCVCVWLAMHQFVSHPFHTTAIVRNFVQTVENLLRFYADASTEPWLKCTIYGGEFCVILEQREKIDGVVDNLPEIFGDVVADMETLIGRVIPSNTYTEVKLKK